MKKLLWVGDAVQQTGFARVTHNILEHLRKHWEVHVLGINYHGDPHDYPYSIYPALRGVDVLTGNGNVFGFHRYKELIHRVVPDAIMILQDPWNVFSYLKECPVQIPTIAYMPVDAENLRGAPLLDNLDLSIFYTDFGLQQARNGGFTGDAAVIPHGVDTRLYKPVNKRKAREKLGMPQSLQDAFLFGHVGRNQPRKRQDLLIRYFARWVSEHNPGPEAKLYLHCKPQDVGWDLHDLALFYGVGERIVFPQFGEGKSHLKESTMPYVYSALDCHITTCQGEGWGLCQAESAACRVPNICPDFAALGEWMADAALMVPCTSTAAAPRLNTIGAIPDEAEFVDALERMYRHKELRAHWAKKGYTRVREGRFRWQAIADQFHDSISKTVRDFRVVHPGELSESPATHRPAAETPAAALG